MRRFKLKRLLKPIAGLCCVCFVALAAIVAMQVGLVGRAEAATPPCLQSECTGGGPSGFSNIKIGAQAIGCWAPAQNPTVANSTPITDAAGKALGHLDIMTSDCQAYWASFVPTTIVGTCQYYPADQTSSRTSSLCSIISSTGIQDTKTGSKEAWYGIDDTGGGHTPMLYVPGGDTVQADIQLKYSGVTSKHVSVQTTSNVPPASTLPPATTGTACSVDYDNTQLQPQQQQGAFGWRVTITNTGTTSFNPWNLVITFPGNPQPIQTYANSVQVTSPSNNQAQFLDKSHSAINAGERYTLNFAANINTAPSSFVLNNVTCSATSSTSTSTTTSGGAGGGGSSGSGCAVVYAASQQQGSTFPSTSQQQGSGALLSIVVVNPSSTPISAGWNLSLGFSNPNIQQFQVTPLSSTNESASWNGNTLNVSGNNEPIGGTGANGWVPLIFDAGSAATTPPIAATLTQNTGQNTTCTLLLAASPSSGTCQVTYGAPTANSSGFSGSITLNPDQNYSGWGLFIVFPGNQQITTAQVPGSNSVGYVQPPNQPIVLFSPFSSQSQITSGKPLTLSFTATGTSAGSTPIQSFLIGTPNGSQSGAATLCNVQGS